MLGSHWGLKQRILYQIQMDWAVHDSDSRRAVQFGKQRHITMASTTLYIVHADIRFVLHG